MYRTWSRRGVQPLVPVTGARHSVKIFGAVDIDQAQVVYDQDDVFNAETYLHFLDTRFAPWAYRRRRRVFYIQDNASYHKDEQVWRWFAANRQWLEVFQLPPYSPEFNAAEPLWHYIRVTATHNTCFKNTDEIVAVLRRAFRNIQHNPQCIAGYLRPFQ